MVATVFRHFVSTLTPADHFPSMRLLRCSAEKLSREDLDAFNRHFEGDSRLRVGFAITETGNISQELIDHNTALPQGMMLGGRLLEDMEVIITDEDGARLPEPDWHTRANTGEFIAPRNSVERTIADIWCEVLGLDTVSITDRFLDLRGDSLKAGRIVTRVHSKFAVEIPLRALLESVTVQDMAVSVGTEII